MYKPIVIIGAPRSGTNMLRDVLCTLDGVGTWPCDEINYIWRHGNINADSDEFTPDMTSPAVSSYIRKQVNKLVESDNLDFVVEKTCANSLRVSFVDKVLPDAHYIFIVRNGLDVVASANLRWTAKLDIPYLMKKVKYVPIFDLPIYGIRYLWSHVYRKFSKEKRLAFWGPSLNDMNNIIAKHTLDEVCAIQWKQCVLKAEEAFVDIPNERITRIKYEDFVNSPVEYLTTICNDIGISVNQGEIKNAVSRVSNKSINKWKGQLDNSVISQIEPIIEDVMQKYGYVK